MEEGPFDVSDASKLSLLTAGNLCIVIVYNITNREMHCLDLIVEEMEMIEREEHQQNRPICVQLCDICECVCVLG